MKITTTAGLVGFLLALSSVNLPKADATIVDTSTPNNTESTIESRLGRIAKVIKEKENQTEGALESNTKEPFIIGSCVGVNVNGIGFGNCSPGFLNNYYGWRNGYPGWGNGGFRNYHGSGWGNGAGWRNGGGFANGGHGGFANGGHGGFANGGHGGGGFANRGGGGGGGFANRGGGGGGFANRGGGGGGFANR